MKVGAFFNWQNTNDWERFRARSAQPPETADAQIYDDELYLADLVEPLGFDSYWAVDHYVTPYGMTGGVLQHLSHIAGRTKRIGLGSMVLVLPWYHPTHVVHAISALDNQLQGRELTLGIGRGAAVREFDAFGVPMDEARGRYDENLEVIDLALREEFYSYEGQHFHIPPTSVRPRFRNPERLRANIKSGWASPQSLPLAANADVGMLLTNQKSWADYRKDVTEFNRIRRSRGWEPQQPTVVVRATCLEDADEAWQVMSKHTLEGQNSSTNHYQFDDAERFSKTKGYEQYAAAAAFKPTDEQMIELAARPQAWGTPDDVYQQLLHIQEMTGASDFVLTFRFGTMPIETAERSMRLFAEKVLPRLHAFDAKLSAETDGTAVAEGEPVHA